MSESPSFPPEHFQRQDEGADEDFYTVARHVAHIDEGARAALAGCFARTLPEEGEILDLMSSRYSHLPATTPPRAVVGLGLNGEEMAANEQLSEHVVHNLNTTPRLPFADARFAACLLSVSVQYLTRPVEVFADVARVLGPGAPFLISISNRMFPTKAVRIWQALGELDRGRLVALYLDRAEAFEAIGIDTLVEGTLGVTDPLFLVHARRRSPA